MSAPSSCITWRITKSNSALNQVAQEKVSQEHVASHLHTKAGAAVGFYIVMWGQGPHTAHNKWVVRWNINAGGSMCCIFNEM